MKGVEGKKQIQMNTHALEAKINAINIIGNVAMALGKNFKDYLETVSQLCVTELIHDKLSSSVRKSSTKLCAVLLDCCADKEQQIKLLHVFLPHIAQEITDQVSKENFRNVKWLTKELQRCLRSISSVRGVNIFSADQTS